MPSLYSDGDDEEDAGREGEVTTALKEGKDKGNETIIKAKVKGKNKKVRKEKEDICYAQEGYEMVEQVGYGSENKDVSEEIMSEGIAPVTKHQKADTVPKQS